ncbi:MAG: hypothetical protein ACD_40C00202G0003 [uncultured bacterium]|nr:MAG: hypothetical protein ACD_40C00202G0003 [uncultured bacterium]KKU25293.1 MAG: hypothetical protein UX37_C0028G0005 [Microgenomates group bacterium GW2011_GWA2_46_16]
MTLQSEFHSLLNQTDHEGIDFLDLYIDDFSAYPMIIFDCFIRARKRGDEALAILGQILNQLAVSTGRPIRHQTIPIHGGSIKLFERHSEYRRTEDPITTYARDFP